MAQTTNKQRLLTTLFSAHKPRPGNAEPAERPVLDQLVYAICREGTTREKADLAFQNLKERFYDWNEIRVSSPREVDDALSDLPDSEARAHRVLSVLQEVFETTFSFDLEPLQKKGLKIAAKQLARYQAATDFGVAWVSQFTLGGHAVPVDAPALRVLRRLGVIDTDNESPENMSAALETLIPKSRTAAFLDAVSVVADEFCLEDDPECARCPLKGDCPTGQESNRLAVAPRVARTKPR
jgi:endonuclease-3